MVKLVLNIWYEKLFRCACSHWELVTTYFRLSCHGAFFSPLKNPLIYFSGTTMNNEHLLHISAQEHTFPFVPMCSLLPETAPVIAAACWGMHGNREKLGAKEEWLCFPNQMTTSLLFLCDLYVLFKVQVGRMTGRSLLKEIGLNNKYNIMKISQGKKEALGANAVNCCLPACFNPSCLWKSNSSRRAAAQKPLCPLGAPQPAHRRGSCGWRGLPVPRSLTADCGFRHHFITNILITHKVGVSILLAASVAGRFSCGMQDRASAPFSAGMGGKRVGLGLPGYRPSLLVWGQWGLMALHPSTPGRDQRSPGTASLPAPPLSNCFVQSHHNPQVNSDFLFIRFSWKTKQLIKKAKH